MLYFFSTYLFIYRAKDFFVVFFFTPILHARKREKGRREGLLLLLCLGDDSDEKTEHL